MSKRVTATVASLAGTIVLAGCGGAHTGSTVTSMTPSSTTVPSTSTVPSSVPGALQAEAGAAATGDIPDNQVFLTYRNPASGYSVKYPEGWLLSRSGGVVTIRDKNNIVRIAVSHGPAPRNAALSRGVRVSEPVRALSLPGGAARKLVYSTLSPANPVTGKRVRLRVDRYALTGRRGTAIIDLGTPVGVDNVDAYRLMAESFRWK